MCHADSESKLMSIRDWIPQSCSFCSLRQRRETVSSFFRKYEECKSVDSNLPEAWPVRNMICLSAALLAGDSRGEFWT